MDLSPAELSGLIFLALVDSTSIGTLVVPVWLLLSPHGVRLGRMGVYLGTAALFYLGVGVLLLAGVDVVSDVVGGLADQTWLRWVQLVVGGALFLWAVTWSRPDATERETPGRLRRWRERIAADASVRGMVVLALAVTVVELAMMLPYLAAVGTISASGAAWPVRLGLLAAYCVVMVLPALVLTVVRVVARERLDPLLRRVDEWITRNAAESTAWIAGIVGFLVAGDAAGALF